jgi:uncharacterized protein YcaQ
MRELKAKHIEKLLQVLKERGPMTTAQLRQALHLSKTPIETRIANARAAGLIHVAGYAKAESPRNYSKRLWAAGSAPDVCSEARIYREDLAERKRRAEQLACSQREVKPFRDPVIAAFFGDAR